jgi:hypothetical protein
VTITRMPSAKRPRGDPELAELFDRFEGHLVTPSTAAALLGISRLTVHTLCTRGQLRALRGPSETGNTDVEWILIPLEDVRAYAVRTGRTTGSMDRWERWLPK